MTQASPGRMRSFSPRVHELLLVQVAAAFSGSSAIGAVLESSAPPELTGSLVDTVDASVVSLELDEGSATWLVSPLDVEWSGAPVEPSSAVRPEDASLGDDATAVVCSEEVPSLEVPSLVADDSFNGSCVELPALSTLVAEVVCVSVPGASDEAPGEPWLHAASIKPAQMAYLDFNDLFIE